MRDRVEKHFSTHNWDPVDSERRRLYRSLKWSIREVEIKEIGLWDSAQDLPHEWCRGDTLSTAESYRNSESHRGFYYDKVRMLSGLPVDYALDTVIVVDGRLRRGREDCFPVRWSVDDGCMRTLAYALDGRPKIGDYVGEIL